MKTKLMIGAVAACAVAAIAAGAKRRASRGQGEPSTTKWDKMQHRMEAMPENFPPRVLFDNVAVTRANTDQILQLLRAERESPTAPTLTG